MEASEELPLLPGGLPRSLADEIGSHKLMRLEDLLKTPSVRGLARRIRDKSELNSVPSGPVFCSEYVTASVFTADTRGLGQQLCIVFMIMMIIVEHIH